MSDNLEKDGPRAMPRLASRSALRGRRVLVVEDEYFFATDLARELEAHGAVVLGPVARIEDALPHLAREGAPDLAVLDVNLGGEMVFPLADELSRQGIPFLFATAYAPWDLPSAFARIPHCEKPVRVRRIAELLAEQDGR